MSSTNQPQRFFGLSGKGLIIIGLVVAFVCGGVCTTALVVERVIFTVDTALRQAEDQPETPRKTPTPTSYPTATPPPTATPRPTNTAAPTSTATPRPGESRSRPLPPEAVVRSGDWEVQLLDFKRSAEAAQLIREANQFNAPAPEGTEYLLLKARVKSLHVDGQSHGISGGDFKLTGDRLRLYLPTGVVPPQPRLASHLFSGGETEGWIVYAVNAGEDRLIALFDRLSRDAPPVFIALQPGTAITVDPALAAVAPNNLGRTRAESARLGDTLITDDWQVTVLEAIRGDKAYELAKAVNQFNDPPAAGLEYLAVRARVKNLDLRDEDRMINGGWFKTSGDKNVLYDTPAVVDPEPALAAYLYPGGEIEGWIILQIGQGEGDAQIIFDPLFDTRHLNRRYIAVTQ
jgi:hypothetical protein